jgi:PiT family inorganic phosphate transporter
MTLSLLAVACVLLAFANGANDNSKGVATIVGSGLAGFREAISWATVTTFAGSLTAMWLASSLLATFSGKGLVDATLVAHADYAAAVGWGAALTVVVATRVGLPISTTHAMVGGLVGAGWAAGSAISLSRLGTSFFMPLLVSPLLASTAAVICYPVLRRIRIGFGIEADTCLCLGSEVLEIVPAGATSVIEARATEVSLAVGKTVECRSRYRGCVLGIEAATTVNCLHWLSAGAVSFARGLNDTPKIAALMLVVPRFGTATSLATVGLAMAIGGLLRSKRVADTMSQRITTMNHGQGFTANLLTSLIVIGASRLGMPVSTTHVSCGALFGMGAVTKQGHWSMIGTILMAWVTTLPLGAAMAAVSYWMLHTP